MANAKMLSSCARVYDMSRLRATLVLLTFAGVTLPLMPVQQLFIWFWPRMALSLIHISEPTRPY